MQRSGSCRASGPANCIARLLALQALRVVLAAIVRRFDFALAPGFMPREWTDRLEDRFILEKGSLPVVISRRVA
jgi:cytochrome P450